MIIISRQRLQQNFHLQILSSKAQNPLTTNDDQPTNQHDACVDGETATLALRETVEDI
jgi:hypothetical protein